MHQLDKKMLRRHPEPQPATPEPRDKNSEDKQTDKQKSPNRKYHNITPLVSICHLVVTNLNGRGGFTFMIGVMVYVL